MRSALRARSAAQIGFIGTADAARAHLPWLRSQQLNRSRSPMVGTDGRRAEQPHRTSGRAQVQVADLHTLHPGLGGCWRPSALFVAVCARAQRACGGVRTAPHARMKKKALHPIPCSHVEGRGKLLRNFPKRERIFSASALPEVFGGDPNFGRDFWSERGVVTILDRPKPIG